ncbi:Lar family restriction alleviation protein [Rhizobium leguminosarum]
MTLGIIETSTLLPCPFCGAEAEGQYGDNAVISCTSCGASVTAETTMIVRPPSAQRDHQMWKAVGAWNERRAVAPAKEVG